MHLRILSTLALSGLQMFNNSLELSWAMHPDVWEGLFPSHGLLGLQLGLPPCHPWAAWIPSRNAECCQCAFWFLLLFLIIYALLYYPCTSFFNESSKASGNGWCHWGAHVNLTTFCSPFAPAPFSCHRFWLTILKGAFLVVPFSLVLYSGSVELSAMCLGSLSDL